MNESRASFDLGPLVRVNTPSAEPDAWLLATHLMQMDAPSTAAATIGTVWRRRAHRLLTALILHQASMPSDERTLHALLAFVDGLSRRDGRDRLRAVLSTEHDPQHTQGWTSRWNTRTSTNPIVSKLVREHLDRPEHEAQSVIRELQLSLLKESA
jgi:hypothetical protein